MQEGENDVLLLPRAASGQAQEGAIPAGRQGERLAVQEDLVLFHPFPGQLRQAQRPEDALQGLAGTQAAHGMEARIEADSLPDKGLEGTARLESFFQEADTVSVAGQDAPAQQAAESGSQDEDVRHCG